MSSNVRVGSTPIQATNKINMKNIELTNEEVAIIENALNQYWNDAHNQLEINGSFMIDGSKRPLGDIEKELLEQRKRLTLPLLRRFENL